MRLFCRILTTIFCLSTICHANGAQPRLTKSTLSSLLQQPTVTAVYRDSRGILWIGTQQGLHRFDGANLTIFDSDRSNKNWVPASDIKDITEDYNGRLHVATSDGVLLKWNTQSNTFDPITQFGSINETKLIRLLATKRGDTWLLSRDGPILYDSKFGSSTKWIEDLKLPPDIGTPKDFIEDGSGNIWIAFEQGLFKISLQDKSHRSFDLTALGIPINSRITVLAINRDGNLILGTSTGQMLVWDIDANLAVERATIAGDSPSYISTLLVKSEALIVGTDRGLFSFRQDLSFIGNIDDTVDRASSFDVHSLYRDGKYIWVGTSDGLNILSIAPFDLFNSKNSGVSNDISAFSEDSQGRLWVGSSSGIYIFDDATEFHNSFRLNSDSPNKSLHIISTISTIRDDVWVGLFDGGMQVVDTTSDVFKTPNLSEIRKLDVTKILSAENDYDIWIATYNHGLFRISSDKIYSYYKSHKLPEESITILFQSNTGILLAISEKKIYLYDAKSDQFTQIHFNFGSQVRLPIIFSLSQNRDGDILIGTRNHGLFMWPRKSQLADIFDLQLPAEGDSLSTSTIYGIEPDSEGNLWCSTQNGIVKLDSQGKLIRRFTKTDGLQGKDFTFGASFTSREGLIYFGGVNGYNRFDPLEIEIDNSVTPMMLTGISLPEMDDRKMGSVDDLKSLQLTHKDHFVTFQFSVLDFIHPERNQYRYKLENFDPDWIDNGTRNTATYTNLPAGDYVFRVQGANSAGIWNRDGIAIDVRVIPAPWYAWWAFCLYGMAILFLCWNAHRVYRSYAIDRKSAQLAKEMFEAENRADDDMQEQLELQDELIQSAFQHNLTTLSLVGDCVAYQNANHPDEIKRDLTESSVKGIAALSCLEDCLYYQAGGPVANLKKYTDIIISKLLKKAPVKPETIITINEVSATLLPAALASPLAIVIYELLENCFQHAFELESPANYIRIKMIDKPSDSLSSHIIELSVRDSGTGFPGPIEEVATEKSGIAMVQSIVNTLGGTLQISCESGTKITLTICGLPA